MFILLLFTFKDMYKNFKIGTRRRQLASERVKVRMQKSQSVGK